MKRLLNRINREVNKQITGVLEDPGRDSWQHPATTLELETGDCEDIQLLKWQLLIEEKPELEHIAYLQRCWGNRPHVVLVVPAKNWRGKMVEYVLDNNSRRIMPKSRAPYDFMEYKHPVTGEIKPTRSNTWTFPEAIAMTQR